MRWLDLITARLISQIYLDTFCRFRTRIWQSKKAGLEGDNEADFIMSEMLVCEMNDIYGMYCTPYFHSFGPTCEFSSGRVLAARFESADALAKAHYSEPREAAMNKAFAEDLLWQFGLVDKLFRGRTHGGPWFASKRTLPRSQICSMHSPLIAWCRSR